MHRPWTRHFGALFCVAIILFAALALSASTSSDHPDQFTAILTALWLVLPAVAVVVVRRLAFRCDEEPASLLSLVLFRAPPSTLPLA